MQGSARRDSARRRAGRRGRQPLASVVFLLGVQTVPCAVEGLATAPTATAERAGRLVRPAVERRKRAQQTRPETAMDVASIVTYGAWCPWSRKSEASRWTSTTGDCSFRPTRIQLASFFLTSAYSF